jgi:hypothetical protein
MKKLQLTTTERNWILPLLNERMETFKEGEFKVPAKYISNLESVTAKVSTGSNMELKQWERIMICSCTNEKLSVLNILHDEVGIDDLTDAYGTLKRELSEIDTAYSILDKVEKGRYKRAPGFKERTSYAEYLERIEKLKRSEIIYLSGSNGLSPYKIAFVHNESEFCTFELRHKIDLPSISFGQLKEDAIQYGRKFFQRVLTREQAFQNLSQFSASDYQEGQFPFLLEMLN